MANLNEDSSSSGGVNDASSITSRSVGDSHTSPFTDDATDPVRRPDGSGETSLTHLIVDGSRKVSGQSGSGTHKGQVWGDFELGKMLGKGGMGAVYLGRQISLDRPVAIKVLPGHLSENESFRIRFQLEAKAVAQISSSHVIQIYAAGIHEDHHYFAMEYVDGYDLAHRIKAGYKPGHRESLQLILQAATGLAAAGELGIVHRDIKPGNMMISRKGVLKLMDFGILKLASENHGLTMTGMIMGTPNYFSPEQGRGQPCDQRSDIYALGVVLYELLTGNVPFTGADATSIIYQHNHIKPIPPKQIDPNIPDGYQAVVLKCLQKNADERYQSAADLVSDLEDIISGRAPSLAMPDGKSSRLGDTPAGTTRSVRRPATAFLIGGAAFTLLAIIAGWYALKFSKISHLTDPGQKPSEVINHPPNRPPVIIGAIPTISALGGSTVRIELPISDPDMDQVNFTWSLQGPAGRSGRLDARTTLKPEIRWTAPEEPGAVTLEVIAKDRMGQEIAMTVPLISAPVEDLQKRDLLIFTRLGTQEPAPVHLSRDREGMWWGLEEIVSRVVCMTPGWLTNETVAFAAGGAPQRPVAIEPVQGDLYVLDGERRTVLVFGRDTVLKRSIGTFTRPSDMAIGGDGTFFVADQGVGAVIIYGSDGGNRRQLAQIENGRAFSGLTRIALDTTGNLYALDETQRMIARFDQYQKPLEGWLVSGDSKPLDMAVHAKGLLVLMASGAIHVYDQRGIVAETFKPLSDSGLIDQTAIPMRLTVDSTGEIFVTCPASKLIVRYTASGVCSGVRGGGLPSLESWAADGQGRLYGINSDSGWIYQYDHEGWCIARFANGVKAGGAPSSLAAIAVTPDGAAIAVIDGKKQNVARYHLDNPHDGPLIFGQFGRKNSEFTTASQIAMDQDGRAYVLDTDLFRVSVFDAKGGFLFTFGGFGKDSSQLREPKLLTVTPSGDAAFIYDSYRYEMKKYDIHHKEAKFVHVAITGSRGDGQCQFRSPVSIGCDRHGLLYVADSGRADVQVIDFRGKSAVLLLSRKASDLGLKALGFAAFAPDGQVYLGYENALVGLRW